MEYTINKLAQLAGISTRTLRYYDELGLLKPSRISTGGYRIYGGAEIARLQQILFYREMEVPLEEIRKILDSSDYDDTASLEMHLKALMEKQARLERLIMTVEKTIAAAKGEGTMTDKERFEGFKENLIQNNEEEYGREVRERYGDETMDASNNKLMGLTQEQYDRMQNLSEQFNEALREAIKEGDPAGERAQAACRLHKEWLCCSWPSYSIEAHLGLADMYVEDERFRKYYEDIATGGAAFLRDALRIYCR